MYAVLSRITLIIFLLILSCSPRVHIGDEWLVTQNPLPDWVNRPFTADQESAKLSVARPE